VDDLIGGAVSVSQDDDAPPRSKASQPALDWPGGAGRRDLAARAGELLGASFSRPPEHHRRGSLGVDAVFAVEADVALPSLARERRKKSEGGDRRGWLRRPLRSRCAG